MKEIFFHCSVLGLAFWKGANNLLFFSFFSTFHSVLSSLSFPSSQNVTVLQNTQLCVVHFIPLLAFILSFFLEFLTFFLSFLPFFPSRSLTLCCPLSRWNPNRKRKHEGRFLQHTHAMNRTVVILYTMRGTNLGHTTPPPHTHPHTHTRYNVTTYIQTCFTHSVRPV